MVQCLYCDSFHGGVLPPLSTHVVDPCSRRRRENSVSAIACLSDGQIEGIAQLLGDCGTGSEIDRTLDSCGILDNSGESTKWKRLYYVFLDLQKEDECANRVLDFIRAFLSPVRFVGRKDEFVEYLSSLNEYLSFSGIEFGADGNYRRQQVARTLDEAEQRVQRIRSKFKDRLLHPEVLKYCRTELMQDNYFHAVFEATKGLAQRIRDISGYQADGAVLVDRVFAIDRPLLAINSLRTETEKSQHKGLAALLKGCFGAIRNPLAHEPRILWSGEDDAADYLSLISLLHRKLDDCVPTRLGDSE